MAWNASLLRAADEVGKTQLLVRLPDNCPTPDGMAIDGDGRLVVACPNYGDANRPARLIRINRDRTITDLGVVPPLEATGRACPMGIAFGPDGDLYVCDNQNWPTGNGSDGEINQGRILRLRFRDDKLSKTTVVARNLSHPNGVRCRGGKLYVTVSMLPKVKRTDGLLTSAVYVFPADGQEISVTNTLADQEILATFVTRNRHCQYGADGLVFDSQGDLYVGNFGDGALHKITLDEQGQVQETTVFARTDHDYALDPSEPGFLSKATKTRMRTTDGICIDERDNIYVADFSNNAIAKVSPEGEITILAQNGDTDGSDGLMDQPGEPILWDGKLVVTCFDMVTGPDKVNTGHDKPYTIVFLTLP
jgi:sugar lactone lactonase YvrE